MRRIAGIIALALFLSVLPTPAVAAEISICGVPVKGKILETALKASGGEIQAKLGCPTGPETRLVVSSRNTYHTHFKLNSVETIVFWSSYAGGKWWTMDGAKPNVGGVGNDRDALETTSGLRGGMLMRSAKLNDISTTGRQLLVVMGHAGKIIDLRDSGTRDPDFPYISQTRTGIPGHSTRYNLFVTGSAERAGISKALQVIADSEKDQPIWVHCAVGRDRTGVIVALIMLISGASMDDVYSEYLRTGSAEKENLALFFRTVSDRYGSGASGINSYLKAIGVTDTDKARIKNKFALAS